MGRKSITGGVFAAGPRRIRFDFSIEGQRFRPSLPWVPNETNLRRARIYLTRIKAQIEAGTFHFADEFPRYRGLQRLPSAFNRDPVAKYSMTSSATKKPAWRGATWRQSPSARIARSSITFGDRAWEASRSWAFGIRCCSRSLTPTPPTRRRTTTRSARCAAPSFQLRVPGLSRASRPGRFTQVRENRQQGSTAH